ncbi:MAG: aldehyde dehydrogenase family protein [Rhodobacteraceae bacterium]|nr:aldehyde dehydrogenase family protein [Paracoccaceae bacterium]
MIEKRQFYINGSWVDPKDGRDHQVINPSTEEACATISLGGQADTDAAVAAAKAALPAWMATPVEDRIALVGKLLDLYNTRAADMAGAISMEMGAPIDMATGQQTPAGSWHLKNFIHAAKGFEFDRPLNDRAPNDRIIYEAVGVAALITPWNWPMNQVTLKVGAAAIAGCTMVLKPSEESPLNAMDTLKRVHLELGGKGANIIFADADEKAVKRGVLHCMNNTGQSCNAPTRMLVQRDIYDQAVEIAAETAAKVTVGSAGEEGRHIGPVVNAAQFEKIQGMIEKGIEEGARLIAGGPGRPEGMNRGYFIRPTVFADCNNDMTIMREEIFGPVLSMMPFDTEEEAIEIANDTVYGLTNYVQTQDSTRANRLARALRSGMVEMNGTPRGAGAPFGGMKQSGNGREGGLWGIEDFLEVKSVSGWKPDA